jgi:dTDP-4-dehydrorhamnose 3,5-epimerase
VKFNPTPLPGVLLIEPDVFSDPRGYFLESYHQKKYAESGISGPFVQSNLSKSSQGTLRGLHAQLARPQAKLIHIVSGEIWDVAVDARPDSPTYKKWYGTILSSEKPRQMYVPVGFVHGFCVLSDSAIVEYQCTDLYDPSSELHLLWNDPEIGIEWPVKDPVLSAKDRTGMTLRQAEPLLKRHFTKIKSK